jgi:hypothetical protein
VTGKVCGSERSLIHCKDKDVSTTNLIAHVEAMSKKCVSHATVDGVLKDASPNYVNVNDVTGSVEDQKLSGTSRMFRGASVLEPQESEMTEPASMLSVSEVWKNKST